MPVRPLPKLPLTPPKSPSLDAKQEQNPLRSPYSAQRPQSLDWNIPSPSSMINKRNHAPSKTKHQSQAEGPASNHFVGSDRYEDVSTYSNQDQTSPPSPQIPNPPNRKIKGKTTLYTFVFHASGYNCMDVIPHVSHPSTPTAPAYHLAVQMNCFIPGVFQTTLYRGHDNTGEIVGDFELSSPDRNAVVGLHGEEFELASLLLVKEDWDGVAPRFEWARNNLRWNCSQVPNVCTVRHANGSSITVAKFTTCRRPRKPGEMTPPLAQLELFSPGAHLLDDIILSILIVEQIRLGRLDPRSTPKSKNAADRQFCIP
jgi:hypothetical protein